MSIGARSHIPALTGLRGVAAGWVTAYHAWHAAGAPALALGPVDLAGLVGAGYFGVDLFFVLSGFLLGQPFVEAVAGGRPLPRLRRFWQRRMLRVLPAYWGQLLVLLAVALWLDRLPERPLLTLATHLPLVFNLFPYQVQPLNPVYWSLPVEWDFYLLLPLLALALRWLRWPGTLLLVLAGVAAYRWLCWSTVTEVPPTAPWSWWVGGIHQLPARLDQFLAGMTAAAILPRLLPHRRVAAVLLAFGAAGVLALAIAIGPRGDVFGAVEVPLVFWQFSALALLFAAVIAGAAVGGSRVARVLASRPLVWTGMVSYSLYLWHYPLLQWQREAGLADRLGVVPALLLTLLAVALVSTLSWWALERPFLRPRRAQDAEAPQSPTG